MPTATGEKVSAPTRMMLINRLKKANVTLIEGGSVAQILPNSVIVEDKETKQQQKIGNDYVVMSMGTASYNPLEASLQNHFENVFVLGDANDPSSITNAIKDGFEKAYVIESLVINKKATVAMV